MIGSVSPAMHKYIWKPATWVLVHKFKALFTKHPYSMYELKICRDYRDGKVTKEDLDKCSTCDMNCVINNGLSEASKEQLKTAINDAILELCHGEAGPVHINLFTTYSNNFVTKELPNFRVVRRIISQNFPEIPKGNIGIFVGAHEKFTAEETAAIDGFCHCK